jgi:hypothetical protein
MTARLINTCVLRVALLFLICHVSGATGAPPSAWGTYTKPFRATSPWNSRPVSPVLGSAIIPPDQYYPAVGEGPYSTGVFLSSRNDPPVNVTASVGTPGIKNADTEFYQSSITIPRWPLNVVPASGLDGHADIVDPVTGIIHSFTQLKNENGKWTATQYAWMPLNGSGWADPAHYFQGARAAGVPPMAGLIRKDEVADGDTMYRHALTISLTYSALSRNPTYIFPATSADGDAATTNLGNIAEGTLLMLPADFDTTTIQNSHLRKVANTLKVYGAYVVDRNYGTPFYIYVENGSGFNLYPAGWDNSVAGALDSIRQALRPVVGASSWLDANGKPVSIDAQSQQNLLSMRGTWQLQSGTVPGVFDSWAQAVLFPKGQTVTTMVNYSNRGIGSVSWGTPITGAAYRFSANGAGGAKIRLVIYDRTTGTLKFDSGSIAAGQGVNFVWPISNTAIVMYAYSGTTGSSSVQGQLMATH